MKPPKFIGIFPSQFPGWGCDDKPVFHHKCARTKDGDYVQLEERQEKACEMAFHPPGGFPCMTVRYDPMGVAGIDVAGNCWVLVRDLAYQSGGDRKIGLRWVKFTTEAAE